MQKQSAGNARRKKEGHRQQRRDTVLLITGVVFGVLGNITASFLLDSMTPESKFVTSLFATAVIVLLVYFVYFKGITLK